MNPALIDPLGRRHTQLRLSLTERCTLRCTYCMPAEGLDWTPNRLLLTTDELERVAALFVGMGVNKVRLTGGEPLARKDAVEVARRIGAMGGVQGLAMTTNGLALEKHLPALDEAGVTQITLSLDTLRDDRFRTLTRRDGLDRVLGAMEAALARGYGVGTGRPLKINVVVLRNEEASGGSVGNDDEVQDLAALALRYPVEVRFIEWMPFAGLGWEKSALVPWTETHARIEDAHGPLAPREDAPDSTSRTFTFARGGPGRVGFIASMSAPFCRGCTRLRVTADGALKVCLFGSAEVSLRDAMREGATDDDLRALVAGAVARKKPAHDGQTISLDALASGANANRSMIAIGG
ncbi:GTP 3',8-cyclase MoaA [Rubricoccus marinus]|uniref:Cyclic pyranopterin phosphate synthase MoaA n=1 Tax=Rubricoccus marinus TaxID=716817 RepID=A0A259U1N4_9BACT|nr:GTP 3',8-cyclase MoaA [Rubricoccus marinus]OZC03892.1 cyclic pyranopterin phosphate synthase MoaA [Rubricoccus marinus]